jgi:hypothetical protein
MLQYIVEMYVESTHVKMDRIDGLSALGRGILITIGLTPVVWKNLIRMDYAASR